MELKKKRRRSFFRFNATTTTTTTMIYIMFLFQVSCRIVMKKSCFYLLWKLNSIVQNLIIKYSNYFEHHHLCDVDIAIAIVFLSFIWLHNVFYIKKFFFWFNYFFHHKNWVFFTTLISFFFGFSHVMLNTHTPRENSWSHEPWSDEKNMMMKMNFNWKNEKKIPKFIIQKRAREIYLAICHEYSLEFFILKNNLSLITSLGLIINGSINTFWIE